MSSDRDDGRRHGGGADGTAGQGDEPSPGRSGARLDELRARMRAIESNAKAAASLRGEAGRGGESGNRASGAARSVEAEAGAGAGIDAETEGDETSSAFKAGAERKPRRSGLGGGGFGQRRNRPKRPAYGSEMNESEDEPERSHTASGRDAAARPRWPATWSHRPGSLDAEDESPRLAAAGEGPANPGGPAASELQSGPDSGAEAAFDNDYTPLFDESLSDASRGSRRRGAREQTATQRALGLLTRREHSRKELTRKLTSRGLDREEAVAAVDQLADAGWQNDARFAESMIRSRAGNGYGPVHIRAELAMHGLDSQIVAEALQNYEGDWLDNARELARRRYGEGYFLDPALRRKAADLLIRRGFDSETVRNASRSCAQD